MRGFLLLMLFGSPGDVLAVGTFGGESGARRAWTEHREQIEAEWARMGKTGSCWGKTRFGDDQ